MVQANRAIYHKFSGYIDDLSPEQEQVMHAIVEWCRSTGTIDMDELVFDNTDILRFCRARKFQEAKI